MVGAGGLDLCNVLNSGRWADTLPSIAMVLGVALDLQGFSRSCTAVRSCGNTINVVLLQIFVIGTQIIQLLQSVKLLCENSIHGMIISIRAAEFHANCTASIILGELLVPQYCVLQIHWVLGVSVGKDLSSGKPSLHQFKQREVYHTTPFHSYGMERQDLE